MLRMMNKCSPPVLGCFCHPPESYIAADVKKKQFINFFFSNDIRVAASWVIITACTLSPFTEQNADFFMGNDAPCV